MKDVNQTDELIKKRGTRMNSAECDKIPKDLRKKLEAEGIDPEMVICWRKENEKYNI